jgi:DNA-binding CsgD family transcriptional regulator
MTVVREAAELRGDDEAQGEHLLGGLCRTVGADVSIQFGFLTAPGPARPTSAVVVGLSPDEATNLFRIYASRSDAEDPIATALRSRLGAREPIAIRRHDAVDDRSWYGSQYVEEIRRPLGIDNSIYSLLDLGAVHYGLSVNRGFGERPFGDTERALIEIFHAECAWLLRRRPSPAVEQTRRELSPRERETLDWLLRGLADKEIAGRMQLSAHTVRQYVKGVYRAFDVTGRAELLALWSGAR